MGRQDGRSALGEEIRGYAAALRGRGLPRVQVNPQNCELKLRQTYMYGDIQRQTEAKFQLGIARLAVLEPLNS
jgi:hypothetical protein